MLIPFNFRMPFSHFALSSEIPLMLTTIPREEVCEFLSTNDTFIPSPNCNFYNGYRTEAVWSIAAILNRVLAKEWLDSCIAFKVGCAIDRCGMVTITGQAAIMQEEWAVNLAAISERDWRNIMSAVTAKVNT